MAIGECGLDYDRFHYSSKEDQTKVFPPHFELAQKFNLPMYLHSRACEKDFLEIISKNRERFPSGVVHSFTGSLSEMKAIVDLDLYLGGNGCSLKTAENMEIVKLIPLERMMIETDSPYCGIRKSHASYQFVETVFKGKVNKKYDNAPEEYVVKGRNEPCQIVQVAEVVARLKGVSVQEVARVTFENSVKMLSK